MSLKMESHEHWRQKFKKKIERRSSSHIEYYLIQSVNRNYILSYAVIIYGYPITIKIIDNVRDNYADKARNHAGG